MIAIPPGTKSIKEMVKNHHHYPVKPITAVLTNGFFTVDKKWTVTYWNNAAEKLLGVAAEDIVGKNLWDQFAGIIPLEFYTVYQKAFLQDNPQHFEEYWGEMGAWFNVITYHCDDSLSVSFKSSNHPHDAFPDDAAGQLKTLTELYRFVTEITNDCLWEWDLTSEEIFWIDGGHKRVMGYQVENALIPQAFWESRIHPDDKERLLTKLHKTIASGTISKWEDDYRFAKADGSYIHLHDRGHIIYEDGSATRIIGATQDITEKVLLEIKLNKERRKKHREITAAVLSAQERERTVVGAELHDNLGQVLAVIKMYIQMAKGNEKNREMYLEKSSEYLTEVITGIRHIYQSLIVPNIVSLGLPDNIRHLIHELSLINPIEITYTGHNIDHTKLDEKFQVNLFRIVQEQLNNIILHSGASTAQVDLSREKKSIVLLISDDGKGADHTWKNRGVGITNIRSRAELYKGKITVVSKPGKGFTLKVVLPLSRKKRKV